MQMEEQKIVRVRTVEENMIFNTVGSLVYFVSQWFLTVLIVQISGFADAGLLSLAMSATAAPAIVGIFNIRNYQVSDLTGQYKDKEYIRSRIYTNLLSVFVCLAIVLFYGYTGYKALIIMTFMAFKLVEGMADVYYGIEQKNQRMDYAGISLTVRGLGGAVAFFLILLLSQSLFLSIVGMGVFSLAVVLFYDRRLIRAWQKDEKALNKNVLSLLITCFPLAVVAFLNNLSLTLPRLYLERYFGEEALGIFFSVSSPTMVVQLAGLTLFAPLIPPLTLEYNKGDKKAFLHGIRKFAIILFVVSIITLIGAWLLGRWGLVLLFGSGIEPYAYLFVPVILTSILIAINASMFSICTLIRAIKSQYIIGLLGILAAIIASLTLVKEYSMNGVVMALAITLLIQILIQVFIIYRKVRTMGCN
jgi:O-antigen/teichoic acid export membrane protein